MSAPINTALLCHPATPCAAIDTIDITVMPAADGGLTVRYRVHGVPDGIRLPSLQPSSPTDGLWQHTCCEAFIAAVDGQKYREFNFSPSSQWAAYRFTAYRERDASFAPRVAPRITLHPLVDGFQLEAELGPALLPEEKTLLLGLTTVIEASDGSKSYWALQHCAAQPDFHLRQSFALTLHRNTP